VSRGSIPLVICSKSAWTPAIRREHALAKLAAAHGHPVTFIERPLDLRALGQVSDVARWLRGLSGAANAQPGTPGIEVLRGATVLPGHLNGPSEVTSNLILKRLLTRTVDAATLVVNVPWQWPASSALGVRRVFDCADDWSVLMPHRRERLTELYRQIGREADAIVLANPSLSKHFPGVRTALVRNGVSEDMLDPMTPSGSEARLVHAGTLSPRFDADLAAGVLEQLPGWTLDLYGQCQYPGQRDRPGPELARLLTDYAPRVRLHGVVSRTALSGAIDRGAVALVLNRPELSVGQDSMKLYDYAARGRPIVATSFAPDLKRDGPPRTRVADDAPGLAQAVLDATREPPTWAQERRRWAEERRWETRWPGWSDAIFGACRSY
jgi:hypothetical protein